MLFIFFVSVLLKFDQLRFIWYFLLSCLIVDSREMILGKLWSFTNLKGWVKEDDFPKMSTRWFQLIPVIICYYSIKIIQKLTLRYYSKNNSSYYSSYNIPWFTHIRKIIMVSRITMNNPVKLEHSPDLPKWFYTIWNNRRGPTVWSHEPQEFPWHAVKCVIQSWDVHCSLICLAFSIDMAYYMRDLTYIVFKVLILFDFLVGWFQLRGFAACPRCNSHPVPQLSFQAPQRLQPRMVWMGRSYEVGAYPNDAVKTWEKWFGLQKNILKIISMVILIYFDDTPYIWIYIYICVYYIGYMWLDWKLWWSKSLSK